MKDDHVNWNIIGHCLAYTRVLSVSRFPSFRPGADIGKYQGACQSSMIDLAKNAPGLTSCGLGVRGFSAPQVCP